MLAQLTPEIWPVEAYGESNATLRLESILSK